MRPFLKRSLHLLSTAFFIAAFFTLFFATDSRAETFKFKDTTMGTALEVTLIAKDSATANDAFNAVVEEFTRIEREMSEWIPETSVSKLNDNAGEHNVKVDEETFKVIKAALDVSKFTHGAFDITWASMRGLWDFRKGKERVPTKEEVAQKLIFVDYRFVQLIPKRGEIYITNSATAIGLGGIAKGYAVDMAMSLLSERGIENAIIKAGGDIRVQGSNSGKPWQVGIQHPRDREKVLVSLPLENISISTSGDYERYFMKDGTLYHHIIDTRTGFPARGTQSVTVLAPDTMTSDALSTSVFVLGPTEGMRLVEELNGIEAIIVDSSGKLHTSSGIGEL